MGHPENQRLGRTTFWSLAATAGGSFRFAWRFRAGSYTVSWSGPTPAPAGPFGDVFRPSHFVATRAR